MAYTAGNNNKINRGDTTKDSGYVSTSATATQLNTTNLSPGINPLIPLGNSRGLRREAFNRKQFDDTIDTSFNELGVTTIDVSTFDPSLATVGDFFTIYQTLFFQIPKAGDINSHEFLIKESTEYTQFVAQQAEIDALLAEIDELRAQNVELVRDMTNQISSLEEAFTAAQANQESNSNNG